MITPHAVTGDQFSKMLMKAGRTKDYVRTEMKRELHEMKLENGQAASRVIYDKHMHVTRHDAEKIIQHFKEKGLAHGVVGHTKEFVRKSYIAAHQDAAQANQPKPEVVNVKKEALLKRQHLAEHARSIEAEKAQEAAITTPSKTAIKKPIAPVKLATNLVRSVGSKPDSEDSTATNEFIDLNQSTTITSSTQPGSANITAGNANLNQESEPELIDMAID